MELIGLFYGLIFSGLLFGIAAAVVGSNRGEGGFWWFVLGAVFGPIGLAAAFFAGVKCPECDSRISAKARICPRCRSKVEWPEPLLSSRDFIQPRKRTPYEESLQPPNPGKLPK